jgi:hypothetical protein
MILNLTQHTATPDQIAAGVVELNPDDRAQLVRLLTFDELPSWDEVADRATSIAALAAKYAATTAMIGGAPYLMAALELALLAYGVEPVYAFSERVSREEMQADGSVRKTSQFRFGGFVRPYATTA